MNILYIQGLPRSGSTFLQDQLYRRIICSETLPETWLLALALQGFTPLTFGDIGGESARMATELNDRSCFARYITDAYKKFLTSKFSADPPLVFIEKTPRNIFLLDFLQNNDEDITLALLRNPIDVLLSSIDEFCLGKLMPLRIQKDFIQGSAKLVHLIEKPGTVTVKYEAVKDPDFDWGALIASLGFEAGVNARYDQMVLPNGRFGDSKFKRQSGKGRGFVAAVVGQRRSVSWLRYIVLWKMLRHAGPRELLSRYYGLKPKEALDQKVSLNLSPGFLDLISLVVDFLSAASNAKVIYLKLRERSFFSTLR